MTDKIKKESTKKGTQENNHLGTMSYVFLNFQIDNLRSIVLLTDYEIYTNAIVVSRMSLEAMALLRRSVNEGQEWAYRWRCFSVVEDYWRFKEMKERGEKKDDDLDECQRYFKDIYHLFLREEKGSSLFIMSSIISWKNLIESLQSPKSPCEQRIYSFLNPQYGDEIKKCIFDKLIDESLKNSIIDGFNEILNKEDFFDSNLFSEIEIDEENMKLYKKGLRNLNEKDLQKFNRSLFELIYPGDIIKGKKKRKKRNRNIAIDINRDDYHENWCFDKTAKEIFNEITPEGIEDRLYSDIYAPASKIIHCSPTGPGQALEIMDNRKHYSSARCTDLGAMSLLAGFISLSRTLKMYDYSIDLGFHEQIEQLASELVETLEKQNLK